MREGYADFIRGVDISTLKMVEGLGGTFYENGSQVDCVQVLANGGANYCRLRLWVNPFDLNGNSYGGGTNDYATTSALAKRALARGMKFLLDFHYSDFWADPGRQLKPKAWSNLSFSDLKTMVYNYTKGTLDNFKSEGIIPDAVQVGNEITAGMLWDDGRVGGAWEGNFTSLAELLASGIAGVRNSVGTQSKIILHLDQGGRNSTYTWWFDSVIGTGVTLDYDIIGLSYYPMWHGTLNELLYNLNDISSRYDKDVAVVETAYGWTTEDGDGLGSAFSQADVDLVGYPATPQGQIDFMNDLEAVILNVANNRGLGFFYWEPAWTPVYGANWTTAAGQVYISDTSVPNNSWDNLTVFDFSGNVLESIRVFNEPNANLLANPGFEEDNLVTGTPSGWQLWAASSDEYNAIKTEWGGYSGDWKLTFWKADSYSCSAYQTFSGLENGAYTLSAWIMGNGGQKVCQLYAKNYGGTEKTAAIPVSDINWNRVEISEIEVTNGQCEVGIYTEANANDWVNIDLVMFRKRK